MTSLSLPGMYGWGNLPELCGALGLSPSYGEGLGAPFLFSREVAGMADSTGQQAWTSPVIKHDVPVKSRFLGRPQLLTR
jgi:hypothetical protein